MVLKNRDDYLNNHYDSHLTAPNDAVGGNKKECDTINKKVGHIVENTTNNVGVDMEKQYYALNNNFEQNPFRINPHNYDNLSELCKAVYDYSMENENRSPGFLDHIMRYTRLMADKAQPFPIDFFNMSYTQFMYHMKWYKDTYYNKITGKNYYGLKHRLATVQEFLIAYGINPSCWRYTLPSVPKRNFVYIPPPDVIHQIINYNFYPNNPDRTVNLQYIHAHNFWIGPRPPSELCLIPLDKINFDEGSMEIIEQKKHYSIRTIYPENPILFGKTRKSIKNYIDHVRPKFETSSSPNTLYLTTEGKAYTPRYLGKELSTSGKMVCKLFHSYTARHWCASARLVKAWLNIKSYPDPLNYVQGFLGHDEQATTEGYVCQARELFRKYPFDWINSTLKFDKKYIKGESALKSKQGLKTYVSNGNPPEGGYGLAEI